jgi:hypothetical protein
MNIVNVLILRNGGSRRVSKDGRGEIGASWFETRFRAPHHEDFYVLSFVLAIRISLAIWLVRLAISSRSRRAAAGSLSSTR